MDKSWIDQLKFKDDGLMPAVIQDYANGQVLMVGYMNKEAIKLTLESGLVHFYSRSRQKMWKKGETSGHIQNVREILLDCDEDTLLIKIEQECASCHKGYRTCFYRKVNSDGSLETIEKKIFEPKDIY